MEVVAVKAIGARNDSDTVEPELGIEGEQHMVVPGQSRQVVDQHALELAGTCGGEEGFEARPVPYHSGLCLVSIDVCRVHAVATRDRQLLTGPNLILDTLRTLVVR